MFYVIDDFLFFFFSFSSFSIMMSFLKFFLFGDKNNFCLRILICSIIDHCTVFIVHVLVGGSARYFYREDLEQRPC